MSSSPSRSPSKPGVCAVRSANAPGSRTRRSAVEQRRQVLLEPPGAVRAGVPVGGWIEHHAVVPPAAPCLALHEGQRVVDDPAHRPVRQPGQLGVPPRPCHGRSRRVHVRHRRVGIGHRQRAQSGVGEEVQDGRGSRLISKPREHRGVLGKEAQLTRLGRPELHRQPVDHDRPGVRASGRSQPAAVPLEAEAGGPPRGRIPPLAEGARRRPIDDVGAEPLEAGRAAHVQERVVGSVGHRGSPVTGGVGGRKDRAWPPLDALRYDARRRWLLDQAVATSSRDVEHLVSQRCRDQESGGPATSGG